MNIHQQNTMQDFGWLMNLQNDEYAFKPGKGDYVYAEDTKQGNCISKAHNGNEP